MKLLYQTTKNFFIATLVIVMLTSAGLYFVLLSEVSEEMNEQLMLQAEMASQQKSNNQSYDYPLAWITPTQLPSSTKPVFRDTLVFDVVQQVTEDYRYLHVVKEIDGQNYLVKVMTTYIGWDSYYRNIFLTFLATIFLLFISGGVITYFSNKKIWHSFFQNLHGLKNYTVSNKNSLVLYDSPVTEFKEMKRVLEDLAARSHKEYTTLKEFTENASHEIQTPLSIIQSELDRLSQLTVTEEMAKHIVQARSAVARLEKTNRNLLLLAKLNNNIFEERRLLPVHEMLQQHLLMMTDLFAARNIHLATDIKPGAVCSNAYLFEILISNLLSNALHYSDRGCLVEIKTDVHKMIVSNKGAALNFPANQLFSRFKKGNGSGHSSGLGLAIAHQVCVVNGWKLSYTYREQRHFFIVEFVTA